MFFWSIFFELCFLATSEGDDVLIFQKTEENLGSSFKIKRNQSREGKVIDIPNIGVS